MKTKFAFSAVALILAFGSSNVTYAFGKAKPNPEPTPEPTSTVTPQPVPTIIPEPVPSPTPTPTVTLVPAPATPEITLGDVSAGGSGCQGGFVSSQISSDNLMVRMTFDQFLAQVGNDGKVLDRKACSIAIPVLEAAAGKRLVVAKVVVLGNRNLIAGSTAKVGFEAFFSGSQGQRVEQAFDASSSEGMFEIVQDNAAALGCGEVGIFRVNASALVQNYGSASVDEVVVFFKLSACQAE